MEPKLPTPHNAFERPAMGYGQNLENYPPQTSPEVGLERGAEQFEQRSEAAPAQYMPAGSLPAPMTAPLVVAPEPVAPPAPVSDTPTVAADEDLIEKEWVDKAKKIILETKDDPYRREQEVGKLQADYLQKRYGKELGASQ